MLSFLDFIPSFVHSLSIILSHLLSSIYVPGRAYTKHGEMGVK